MLVAFIHALCAGLQDYTRNRPCGDSRNKTGKRKVPERKKGRENTCKMKRVSCAAVAICLLANKASACRTQKVCVEGKKHNLH